jgi:pimeloyl-ACP methyl ester carboxylesterase
VADGQADNELMAGLLSEGRVTANGLRFAYLEGGSGPLVVLLHGWPDTPHTWDYQMAALAGAGFRVVAPWLRGYPPTEIPQSGYFDIGTLAADVRELIRALGGGDRCLLVGQDWGASIGYQVLAAFPEVVQRAVVMAVPHPVQTRESLLRAENVHRSFHWFFFQLPQLPERALRADDYAFVDWLWDYWTVPGFADEEHLAEVKRMLAIPGALEATLGYYRAMFDPGRADPDLAEVRQATDRPITVPTLALCGAQDQRAGIMQGQDRHFAGPYRFELVPGSGHFLQREQPQAVTELILDWLTRQ